MFNRFRHVLFDFDGTLCDSKGVAMEEYERLRTAKFPQLPGMQSGDSFDVVYAGPLKTSLTRWLSQEETDTFFNLHSRAMEARTTELVLFGGMADLLQHLPQKSFSIVTSAYSEAVKSILVRSGIESLAALYKISGRELQQPKTVKILSILDELGVQPNEAIYVGDLESDMLYCQRVPIRMVGVGFGYQSPAYMKSVGPTYFAETVEDLDRLLSKLVDTRTGALTLHEFD